MNEHIEETEFLQYFSDVYVITNINKYRSFQFRLLHRAVLLNDRLSKWGVVDTEMCSFCGKLPNFSEFKEIVWQIRSVELYNATKNDMCDKFKKKWFGHQMDCETDSLQDFIFEYVNAL